MMTLVYILLILAQASYWLFWRDRMDEMDAKVWDACLYPGREK